MYSKEHFYPLQCLPIEILQNTDYISHYFQVDFGHSQITWTAMVGGSEKVNILSTSTKVTVHQEWVGGSKKPEIVYT